MPLSSQRRDFFRNTVDKDPMIRHTLLLSLGDVAQLGERCRRMAEAEGSTPFISTRVGSVELFFFRNEFALVYRFGGTR